MDMRILLTLLLSIGVMRRLDAANLEERCGPTAACPNAPHVKCRAMSAGGTHLYCLCDRGFMQNSTREYTKQECVPVVTKAKPHGESCTWGECKEQYVCKNGFCACPAQTPVFVPMDGKCVESSYRGTCYDTALHLEEDQKNGLVYKASFCKTGEGATCVNDVCDCAKGLRPNWHEKSRRCEGPYETEDCVKDRPRCHGADRVVDSDLECVADKCACVTARPVWNPEERRCFRRRFGDPCTVPITTLGDACIATTKCIDGTCQCDNDTPIPDPVTKTCSVKSKFGQPCTPENCEPEDLSCQNKVCACKNTSLEFNGVACRSRTRKTLGEHCGGVDTCNAERGLVCEGESCKCGAGRTWAENLCQLAPKPCDNQNQCSAFNGLHCDVEASMCMCPEGKQPSKSGGCKLAVGQTCYEDKLLRHDLCASDLCIGQNTTTVALANLCACADFNGVKYTWSAEPDQGCVQDYFGLPCNPANENNDCRRVENANVRPLDALSCFEMNGGWLCACAEGKAHFQGFCVEATRSHEESCDPRGAEPTCNLDPAKGLVCDKGGSGSFTCQCQKKAITSAYGAIEYGSMTWNKGTQECEPVPGKSGAFHF